jgi:hypothetical protein
MRTRLLFAACGLLTALGLAWANPVPDYYYYVVTPQSLSLPPDAASVALADALAGAGPSVAASFFNPATLDGLSQTEIAASEGPVQNGLWPSKSTAWAGAGIPVGRFTIGVDASLTQRGGWAVDEHGTYLGNSHARDATLGARAALSPRDHWSVGVGLKLYMSNETEDFPMWQYPTFPDEAFALAPLVAAGVRWTPHPRVGLGLSLCDAGPEIRYAADSLRSFDGTSAPSPWTTRLGGRVRVVDLEPVQVDVLAQVGGSWTEKWLANRWATPAPSRSISRSIAADALLWKTISLRLGYLDDPTSDRCGVTLGIGFWMADLLRLDFGTDALTYNYPSPNHDWRLSFTAYDLARLWCRK